jgi:hypothetical protein
MKNGGTNIDIIVRDLSGSAELFGRGPELMLVAGMSGLTLCQPSKCARSNGPTGPFLPAPGQCTEAGRDLPAPVHWSLISLSGTPVLDRGSADLSL